MEGSCLRFLLVSSLFFVLAKTDETFIVKEPEDTEALVGSTATFEFVFNTALVDAITSVRWAIDFADGESGEVEENEIGRYTLENVDGTIALTIHNVTEADGGKYRCIVFATVDGELKVIESRLATLTVVEAIQAPGELYPLCLGGGGLEAGTYYEGEPATIICESQGGVPSAVLTWTLDGSPVDGLYSNDSYARNVYEFQLELSHQGRTFTCTSLHPALTDPRTCQVGPLVVRARPDPLCSSETGETLYLGETATFRCESEFIDSYDDLSWDFSGGAAVSETAASAVSRLTVPVDRPLNGINVTCTATNSGLPGARACAVGPLLVYPGPYAPLVSLEPPLVEISGAETATFVCAATAYPAEVAYDWLVDQQPVNASAAGDFKTGSRGDVLAALIRQPGEYTVTCVATNSNGQGSGSAVLLVVGDPTTTLTSTTEANLGQTASEESASNARTVTIIGASIGVIVVLLGLAAAMVFVALRRHRLRSLDMERTRQQNRMTTPLRPRALLQAESLSSVKSNGRSRPRPALSNGHVVDKTMQALNYDLFNVYDESASGSDEPTAAKPDNQL